MPFLLVAVIGMLWLLLTVRRAVFGFPNLSTRGAFVLAFGAFQVLVAAVTEVASIGHHLTKGTLMGTWVLILIGLTAAVIPSLRKMATPLTLAGAVRMCHPRRLGVFGGAALGWTAAIIVMLGVLAVIGWLYPPNNADSHAYHLARVEHWIQNRSVAHYATHYLAQIELAPLSSYNFTHLHLLSGGSDRLDGYIQWYSVLVCIVGAAELARLFGAGRSVQIVTAVLCATIPSLILEATSTQNNDFTAAVGVTVFVILLSWTPAPGWIQRAVLLGFVTGLTVLAKGTLPMLIAPSAALLGIVVLRKETLGRGFADGFLQITRIVSISAVCAVVVVGPFVGRNIALFGAPTGPVSRSTVSYQLTLNAAVANIARSVAANYMIGNGVSGLDSMVSHVVLGWSARLYKRMGIAPEDPRYFMGTQSEFQTHDYSFASRNEGCGANPWHITLSGLTLLILGIGAVRCRREYSLPFIFGIALFCGFALFTGIARWSIYAVRYQIPFFVGFCPLIGIALGSLHRFLLNGAGFVAMLACLSQLIYNVNRPLIKASHHFATALEPYFFGYDSNDPLLKPHDGTLMRTYNATAYESVTEVIANSSCREVGLANWILLEYPIWAGLRMQHWRGTITAVGVQNESRNLEKPGYQQCAWLREEDPSYIAPDDGNLHLQFDRLALAMSPESVDAGRTKAIGFASALAEVQMLPGGGWSYLPGKKRMALAGRGSLYLYAKKNSSVRIELRGISLDRVPLLVEVPRDARTETVEVTGGATPDFFIPAGITRIRVTAAAGSDPADGGVELTDVAVVAAH